MSLAENKAVIHAFLTELYNRADLSAADAVIISPLLCGAMKRSVQVIREIFPDFCLSIEELISEEDKVVARCSMQGTYQPKIFGLTLLKRSVEFSYLAIYRLKDQKISGFWFLGEGLGLIRQLGPFGMVLFLIKYGRQISGR